MSALRVWSALESVREGIMVELREAVYAFGPLI